LQDSGGKGGGFAVGGMGEKHRNHGAEEEMFGTDNP